MITITAKDIKRAVVVEPAWYVVRVDSCTEKTAKSGTSQNYLMEGELLMNAENGDKKFAGTPTPSGWLFNEGAISFAIPFLKACGAEIDENGEIGRAHV